MKKSLLEDKTLLITGGTGSFGNAMLAAVLSQKFREIRIFSRDELKQEQMRVKLNDPRVKFYIGDVRSFDSIEAAMRGVDYVFHAAALKQVPSCEFFPIQATLTNVTGSQNVIEAAIRHHVKRVVCLSTDKAVYPINTMGITKALMEKVAQAATRGLTSSDTTICSVRYGNVMYSRGSVIPLFVEQIQTGKSFTVTEPSMTRFMLPLATAIDLVLFALERGEQGDIFIRKAPACTVRDLVTAMKNIFHSQATVVRIGMRHGEKIFETLATREELRRSEDMGEYYRVHMDDRDLNYGKYFTEGDMREVETDDYTSHNTQQLSIPEVEELLLALPEIRADLKRVGANRG